MIVFPLSVHVVSLCLLIKGGSRTMPKFITIQFLDVGQGDGIYIEFPNDTNMLVDLGSRKGKRVTGPDIWEYFKSFTRFGTKGATLDYLIVTHPDSDHYNLVGDFMKNLEPKVGLYTYGGPKAW